MNKQYPFLDILIYAYFNQDYKIISGPKLNNVIDDFLHVATRGMIKGLIEEIDSIINTSENVENRFDFLYHDADVLPEVWNMTALEFLTHVSNKSQDYLNKHTEQDE
ncbi:contact-dependent growth inhibition system immunity protein [Photorhabdus sp. SF281]|uniref:contact-dependent growth inhibition system immunity protein n=1 Tax=Photorhabdus sp. SF281 TaxID=3459527 RepID=UPI004044DB99